MDVRVLIVDDSATSRKMTRKSLPTALAGQVTEAAGGQDALRILETEPIDLMFLDLTMAGVSGFDVLEALQARPDRPFTIVVSADVQTLVQERVLGLGAATFLRKPIDPSAVEQALKGTRFV